MHIQDGAGFLCFLALDNLEGLKGKKHLLPQVFSNVKCFVMQTKLTLIILLCFSVFLFQCGSSTSGSQNTNSTDTEDSTGSNDTGQTDSGDSEDSTDSDDSNQTDSGTTSLRPPFDTLSDLDDCPSDSNEIMSTIPIDSNKINYILPLGFAGGISHTFPTGHTYINLTDKTTAIPISAPADMVIYRVDSTQDLDQDTYTYSVSFALCNKLAGHFGHVTSLESSIASAVGLSDDNCSTSGQTKTCSKQGLSIEVAEGTVFASIGGDHADSSSSLDFGLMDQRETSYNLVDSDREDQSAYNPHVVCPYDYYVSGTIKEGFFDFLASGRQDLLENCGTLDTDIENTASGRWYTLNTDADNELDHIHLGVNFRNQSKSNISIGSNTDLDGGQFTFTHTTSGTVNRKFSEITSDGNQYCAGNLASSEYASEDVTGYFLLKLTSATTLKIERVTSGNCPGDPNTLSFTSNVVTYER